MNIFQSFPVRKPKGNLFNLSYENKMSFNMGELIPAYLQDVVPGDRFKVSSEVFLRFAPMLAPIMHRINVYMHYFFVPNRLVWPEASGPTGWETFITGGADGTEEPAFPTTEVTQAYNAYYVAGKLPDYLGIPQTDGLTITQNLTFNNLPLRGYQMIWNEYYRDPNLDTEATWNSSSISNIGTLRNRCWEKDYFTSALPWSQRGGDVNLPVEGNITFEPEYRTQTLAYKAGPAAAGDGDIKSSSGGLQDAASADIWLDNLNSSTTYDLENVEITINDLRQSVRLQQWLERNARGGARYIEQVLSHFGVRSSDARLQRPEYLGGGKAPVVVSEVLKTAEYSTPAEVGEMYGHGVSVGRTNEFNRFFEEHGYVFGIISVMPRSTYQQGVSRHFLKTDKFDYYWPEFANLGEQEIFNQELYHDYEGTDDAQDTFGYQSRYAEYKYRTSEVHGDFKDDLDYWHLGRIFSATPTLNSTFVQFDHANNDSHRIFNVTSNAYDKIYAQIYNNVKAWRPMPKYGVPIL